MADSIITRLDAIAQPGTAAIDFLRKLGPIHAAWHSVHNAGTAQTGFLLFHWELIQRFDRVGGPASFGGVTPFTTNELNAFHANYDVTVNAQPNSTASLETFSQDIELWHNNAHMAIGMAVHKNLMNPRTNVRLPEFWQLHFFINDRFEEQLNKYQAGGKIPAVVAQLETTPAAPST